MKKYFLIIFAAFISLGASAQKGEQNIGAHVLYGTDASNFGLGVKYQYNVTNAIRLEGVADYYLKTDGFSMFDVNINGHYLFHFNKFTVYPLIGINYTHWKSEASLDDVGFEGEEISLKDGSIGLNIGGGAQYNLTDRLRVGAEIKYQTISGASTAVIGVGVTYAL